MRVVLGLQRAADVAYEAFPIGKPIGVDDARLPRPASAGVRADSLQQIYFPTIVNILPEDGTHGEPQWFGVDKRELTARWRSWLTSWR